MHSKYQTKQSNVVYKSEWMTVYEDQVYKRNNITSKVGMFNRIDVCDTAIVIPLFKDGSLLMVDNYRHGVGTDLLELPGGFIDEDEVPLGAAKRELIEETGYTCNKVKVVNWFYTWPGRTGQRNFVVLANGLKKYFRKNRDEPELIKVLRVPRSKVMQELKRGRIKSALTIAALFEGYL
jgi:ADP-ribose diphosphatase